MSQPPDPPSPQGPPSGPPSGPWTGRPPGPPPQGWQYTPGGPPQQQWGPGRPQPPQWGAPPGPPGQPPHWGPPPGPPHQWGPNQHAPHHGQPPVPLPAAPRRAPKILMILGGLMILAAIVVAAFELPGITSLAPRPSEIVEIGTATDLEVTGLMILYQPDEVPVYCEVESPGTEIPDVQYTGSELQFFHDGSLYRSFGQVGAPTDPTGIWRITCDVEGAVAVPFTAVSGVLRAAMWLGGGMFVGLVGLVLFIIGLVLHFVGRR